jgi:hypothetical protein
MPLPQSPELALWPLPFAAIAAPPREIRLLPLRLSRQDAAPTTSGNLDINNDEYFIFEVVLGLRDRAGGIKPVGCEQLFGCVYECPFLFQ